MTDELTDAEKRLDGIGSYDLAIAELRKETLLSKAVQIGDAISLNDALLLSRSQRSRLRKRGVHVPIIPRKKGYKQSPEHIAKRMRYGDQHHCWLDDNITEKSGRSRAIRMHPNVGPCIACGAEKAERHHRDGNTRNNAQDNIVPLCRRCHTLAHGKTLSPSARAKGIARAAELKKAKPNCPQGHPYSGKNLYIAKSGARVCKECTRQAKRRYRARLANG